MTDNVNSIGIAVLGWLNNGLPPEQALYRLLLDEWDIPQDLVVETVGDAADRTAIEHAVNTDAECSPTPAGPASESTYYCEEHDFATENPQSWAAHHTNADHRTDEGAAAESEGLGALVE